MATRTLLELDTTVDGGHAVVRVDGEIDLGTAPKLRETLNGLLEEGVCNIDVDLSGARFMDSSGLAVLVHALRRCQHGGGRLAVCDPSPVVSKLLHTTRLSRLFGVGT
jgi:anti-sigma B factor antagonist